MTGMQYLQIGPLQVPNQNSTLCLANSDNGKKKNKL